VAKEDKAERERETNRDYDEIIDRWFAEHFHNSPVSADTLVHNLLHKAKEDLKTRFR